MSIKQYQLKCTLLSDIIISQSAATEGNQGSLDFIPGSNFLGIAANELYYTPDSTTRLSINDSMTVFHSGKVRFGDAHPAYKGRRSLRVPAAMFYPKLHNPESICYIYPEYHRKDDHLDNNGPQQLKQCRNGFYAFIDQMGIEVPVLKTFAIKSAYDRTHRKAMDEQMFGYEAMGKGMELFFEIETTDIPEELAAKVISSLLGEKHIGRSRTAQYGLVLIEKDEFKDTPSRDIGKSGYATVYADGRLIFLDSCGLPTFTPTAEQLGFENSAEIDWKKSQIRTFQYAPWNYKRHSRDTDRCGIEKGSVFVVRCAASPNTSSYIGSYKNEGFGRVIYNPEFLTAKTGRNGEALFTLRKNGNQIRHTLQDTCPSSTLINFLLMKKQEDVNLDIIYTMVNDYVNKFRSSKEKFASQWGEIRNLASRSQNLKELYNLLFTKDIGYLVHGTAADKWGDKTGNEDILKQFLNELKDNPDLSERNKLNAVINLAAEMAKKCKSK